MEKMNARDALGAGIGRLGFNGEMVNPVGTYTIECRDADGNIKWSETIHNLVTTVGKNDMLDKYLSGSAYTAAWYLGLISSTGYSALSAADTAASHAGWTESTAYSEATRPAPSFSAASAGSKTTSAAVAFSMNATVTIKGCFLISNNTKGGTTGILFSEGLFTGGDRSLVSGDALNVTYTLSL